MACGMMKLLSLDDIYLTLKLLKNYYKFVFQDISKPIGYYKLQFFEEDS